MRTVGQVAPRCRAWGHSRQHSGLESGLDLSPRRRGFPGICRGHLCHGGVCEEAGLEVDCGGVSAARARVVWSLGVGPGPLCRGTWHWSAMYSEAGGARPHVLV